VFLPFGFSFNQFAFLYDLLEFSSFLYLSLVTYPSQIPPATSNYKMVQGGTESIPYAQPMTIPNYSGMMMDGYHTAHTIYPSTPVRSPQPIAKSHHPTPSNQMMYHPSAAESPRSGYARRPTMNANYQVESHMPLTTATVASMSAPAAPSLPPLSQLLPASKAQHSQMQAVASSDPNATMVYSPPHQPHQAPPHADAYEMSPAYMPMNDSYPQQTYNHPATDSPDSAPKGRIISPRVSTSPHTVPTMNPEMIPMQGGPGSQMAMHPLQAVEGMYAYHPMMTNAPASYDGSMMPMPIEEPAHHVVYNQERHSYDSNSSSYSKRQKVFSFVSLPGINQPKRPRRRYDEIERLYHCNWAGCNKSYGTLNHLNAHVSMQKHVSYFPCIQL
jgi:hypothetical protein